MKFTEFKFKDYIQEALKDLNFVETTEVQEKLIPVVLAGRDLVGESKTGSGKTHTFLLPIFQTLNEDAVFRSSLPLLVVSWLGRFIRLHAKLLLFLIRKFELLTMSVELIKIVRLGN